MSALQRGIIAMQSQNLQEALACFKQAVEEEPKNPQAAACYGQALCWQGKRDEGVVELRRSGSLLIKKARKNKDTSQALMMVDQLHYWNDYTGALEIARQAVQINNQVVRGFQLLALTYSRLNQPKSALEAGRQALRLAPNNSMLSILLATLESANKLYEPAKTRLEKVLTQNLSPEEKYRAHKELAIILDKLKLYPEVFPHLYASTQVSALLPEVKKQDASLVPKMLETNTQEFDQALLSRWAGVDFQEDHAPPMFLMGFMRSGTTLTQEVLGTHPDVFVADESDLIISVVNELERMLPKLSNTPQRLRQLDLAGVKHLRNFYWNHAVGLYGKALEGCRLLDKTTMNTIDAGLIATLFPDAKIVFVMRDPRDICLSCFMQIMIPTPSTVHLLGWEETARFYAQTMAFWLSIKPKLSIGYVEFRYEDAVADFETTFRRVFETVGLDWHPDVVDFHKNAAGKYIASPSFSQVAQPLYSSSVARWRRYEQEYAAILPLLAPYLEAFGYPLS